MFPKQMYEAKTQVQVHCTLLETVYEESAMCLQSITLTVQLLFVLLVSQNNGSYSGK